MKNYPSDNIGALFEDLPSDLGDAALDAVRRLQKYRVPGRKANPFRDIPELISIAEILANEIGTFGALIRHGHAMAELLERAQDVPNNNTRWAPQDDEFLVERAAQSPDKIFVTAAILGRSVASCQTRLSELIGIRQEIIRVNGKRIVGDLGEEPVPVDDTFTGVVHR